jgi:glycosyltransferase involved in cell wall biosynthesis
VVIRIGVHVHAEPEGLEATLTALAAAGGGFELLLLPDEPDAPTGALLRRLPHPESATAGPARGAAACFNRLLQHPADLFVLLESGARPAPGWLEALLAALQASPQHGLAGPTTNLSWNEQGAFPPPPGLPLSACAAHARLRYGGAVRSLWPLHSLADFCYAVRREVVEAIGPADEGYGLGPCWEMDYNIRAARAGYLGVWATAAYVHRAPFTARRRREEQRLFEQSRRRYQDRFCGRRLRGERFPYKQHCRGDGCAEFAPAGLIALRLSSARSGVLEAAPPAGPAAALLATPFATLPATPLVTQLITLPITPFSTLAVAPGTTPAATLGATPAVALGITPAVAPGTTPAAAQAPDPPPSSPPAPEAGPSFRSGETPAVTCIMPTRDRRAFVPQAIRGFLRQRFHDAELLILDDGQDPVADLVPAHPRIRYQRLEGRWNTGQKRNEACRRAHGALIAHWDDDDWYGEERLQRQVEALAAGHQLCGSSEQHFYQPSADRAFLYRYAGGERMYVGTSLAYRKQLWQASPFPEIQVGEDVRFVRAASGASIDLRDAALFVGTIHAGNSSPKQPDAVHWQELPPQGVHALLGEELAFFRTLALPLVSCIMPTGGRRRFVELALRAFREQAWPNRELLVIDDGQDPVEDLAAQPGVRYLRLGRRTPIGAKRNLACAEARGELIAHWDDDDWYGPQRLARQCAPILAGHADLSGLVNRTLLELGSGAFWSPDPRLHQRMFVGDVHGGTLLFRRALFAEGLRYPEVDLAEDAALLSEALRRGKRLARVDEPGLFIYMRHGRNAWRFEAGSFLDPAGWQRAGPPEAFAASLLEQYRAAALG